MFYDTAQITGSARITKDGYFVADALVARANNIQEYLAGELGLQDRNPADMVRVFRPASEVFHKDALASLAHRPITLDHPKESVKATNWRDLAVGDVGDEIVRDGEFVRVSVKVMDSAAIESIRTSRPEFSLGYTAEVTAQDGEYEGQPYDYVAKTFRYNHLAAVRNARGGTELRIIDERSIIPPENTMKLTIGDAKDVDLSDGAAVAVAVGALNTKLADADKARGELAANLATATASVEAKDGEIAALNAKLADATVTPEKLQAMADARSKLLDSARAVVPALVADGKSDADIRKEVVAAKLGDAAAAMSDAAIEGAFAVLAADGKSEIKPLGTPKVIGDAKAASDAAYVKSTDFNSWRNS